MRTRPFEVLMPGNWKGFPFASTIHQADGVGQETYLLGFSSKPQASY